MPDGIDKNAAGIQVGDKSYVAVMEGNPYFCRIVEWMVANHYAINETQAMVRFTSIHHAVLIGYFCMWGIKPQSKILLYAYGAMKAWGGHGWHKLKNEFSWLQAPMFLFGDKGRRPPWMVDFFEMNPGLEDLKLGK